MPLLQFTKAHGLGNDFIIVDLRTKGASASGPLPPTDSSLTRALCDRRFGIGGDGVLVITPARRGDARMRVFNADGSEAEMCGNGIRCVAKFIAESDPEWQRPLLNIETGAGVLACGLDIVDGRVRSVAVEMGRPRLSRMEIPMTPANESRVVREGMPAAGRTFPVTAVSMGNPHAVIFVDDDDEDLRAMAERFGPVVEVAPQFPRRTNVEFARRRTNGSIDLVVWERGCGITLACGTGACATAVAAALEERLPAGTEIPVHLPGGTLHITVAADLSGVRMRGPAEIVYTGEIETGELLGHAHQAG